MKKLPKLLNTPARVVIAVGAIVLATEFLIMTMIHDAIAPLNVPDVYWNFIDTILLTLIVSPALYFLVFREMHESEERFNQLTENISEAFWLGTPDWNNVIYISPAYEQIWGRSCESLYTRPLDWLDAVVDADREQVIDAISRKRAGDLLNIAFPEYRILRPDGSERWIFARAFPVYDARGKVYRIAGIAEDITERKQVESALRAREIQLSLIYDNSNDVIFAIGIEPNDHFRFISVNRSFIEATGLRDDQIVGKLVEEVIPEPAHALVIGKYKEAIRKRQPTHWEEVSVFPAGRKVGVVTVAPIFDASGNCTQLIGTVHDITERKKTEEGIYNLAFHDALTQLPNRRLLNDRLGQILAASNRSGRYGALMFMDLDNFKPLNDTHGHGVGDLLLMEVARRITSCVREVDTVARFGGDEFVVILSELDADKTESLAQTSIVAEKIRAILAEPYVLTIQHEGEAETTIEHHCTSCIGVVLFISYEASAEDILKWADMAMYQAKEGGRNLIRFYDSKA